MNVLVYSGSEINQISLSNTLNTLRSLCLPNYTVQPLSRAALANEPWEVSCALFVLPNLKDEVKGATLKDLRIFDAKEVKRIGEYVEGGGAFLGLGLGGRFDPSSTLSSLESSMFSLNLGGWKPSDNENVPIKFFDKFTGGHIYPVAGTVDVDGETLGSLRLASNAGESSEDIIFESFPCSGASLSGFEGLQSVQILATNEHQGTSALSIKASKGSVAFLRPTLSSPSSLSGLSPLLRRGVISLGLQLPVPAAPLSRDSSKRVQSPEKLQPLPQFLTCTPGKKTVSQITDILFDSKLKSRNDQTSFLGEINDAADTFQFHSMSGGVEKILQDAREAIPADLISTEDGKETKSKQIIVCLDGTLPDRRLIPLFDLELYYSTLEVLRKQDHVNPEIQEADSGAKSHGQNWGFGEALLYGERVTSTQSMFDRNPQLLGNLPTPLLSLASQQLAGRGRGSNVWLSPEGCLQFSVLLRVDLPSTTPSTSSNSPSQIKQTNTYTSPDATLKSTSTSSSNLKSTDTTTSQLKSTTKTTFDSPMKLSYSYSAPKPIISGRPTLPANKLVFIQYLFALAVVEACGLEEVLGSKLGGRVRLKWPNDIYADFGDGDKKTTTEDRKEGELRKIGGVLVNTSFGRGKVDIVVGCGLNVLNLPPIASLSQLFPPHSSQTEGARKLCLERTAAAIMSTFERMWARFIADGGSFDAFNGLYLHKWLHSDQRVTLTTTSPPTVVRIAGITPDYGLLRTVPERPGFSGLHHAYQTFGEEPGYIDLQPDGNSFDLMAGLIKAKT